jgi:hypothetical protein
VLAAGLVTDYVPDESGGWWQLRLTTSGIDIVHAKPWEPASSPSQLLVGGKEDSR